MQDVNSIDVKTGYLVFHNIMITKNTVPSDIKGVPDLLVNPKNDSILTFKKSVKSGKVNARVKISFLKTPMVTITPMIGKNGVDMLGYSKMWLKDMLPDEAPENGHENGISYSYDWGYIVAMYMPDLDYGQIGGWIDICYR